MAYVSDVLSTAELPEVTKSEAQVIAYGTIRNLAESHRSSG
jgi:hypothetical protein